MQSESVAEVKAECKKTFADRGLVEYATDTAVKYYGQLDGDPADQSTRTYHFEYFYRYQGWQQIPKTYSDPNCQLVSGSTYATNQKNLH